MYCLIDFCCICFDNKGHLQHLHASDIDNITYFIKLTSCVPEMCFNAMNDQQLVCKTCCETMDAAYKFRQECLRSKTMLRDYISQLREVSNISGDVHVYLTDINQFKDIKKEHSIENILDVTIKSELCKNMDIETNEKRNSETNFETEVNELNPINLKLTDNKPNYIQFKNVVVKMECDDTNFDENIDENVDSSLENQDLINIDVSNNGVNLTAPEIKKENEDQNEHLQENLNNILETSDSENVDLGIKIDKNREHSIDSEMCSNDPLLNLDDIKIDIVDNDIELMNGEINIQCKTEGVDKCSIYDNVIPFNVEDETDKDAYSCLKTEERNRQSASSSEISEHQMCGASKRKEIKNVKIDLGKKIHKCKLCKKTFNHSSNMYRHMRTHIGKKQLHECSIYRKTSNQSKNQTQLLNVLTKQLRTHTLGNPYECNVCKKPFSRSDTLNRHLRTHTLEKPHQCNVCQKSFSQLSNLTQHLRTHTLEKPHECDVCKKSFTQSSHLTRHLRTHTLEKPHECNICKKSFSQSGHLTQHLRTHTLEKPHECNICKKSFSQSGHLTQHLRTHTLEKLYECDICKKSFSRPSILTQHLKTHTLEKLQ